MRSEKTNNQAKAVRVKSSIKAGLIPGCSNNHNQTVSKGLRVKSNVKAGGYCHNHNQTVARKIKKLRVKSNVRAGCQDGYGLSSRCNNHNQTVARVLRIKGGVKDGDGKYFPGWPNHNQTLSRDAR